MKVEQVKPEVLHYERVEFGGMVGDSRVPWHKSELALVAESNLAKYGTKTRFRPVYKKEK